MGWWKKSVNFWEISKARKTGSGKLRLNRINRIKTIQGSLEIEGNTLTVGQVAAVLEGRTVLAPPQEIREVRNAFAAYEKIPELTPHSQKNLLAAHKVLMLGLVEELGCFRSGVVGVGGAGGIIHIAPQAKRIPVLMTRLLGWLERTDEHPLIASSVFHYEFEAIHPFQDGNGRMGRLWQTLILGKWNSLFNFLPLESMVRNHRADYYKALNNCNKAGSSTEFIEFALKMIESAVSEAASDQVTDQVKMLLKTLKTKPLRAGEIMKKLGLKHRRSFSDRYLKPALEKGLIEMTQPDSPRSPTQKYRLTESGRIKGGNC